MELSFGEQIKIILRRKGLTIKDLADMYESRTGKPMSRQNLTQRLKRDNFPEQDMHTIASLLGYQVSVQLIPAAMPELWPTESAPVSFPAQQPQATAATHSAPAVQSPGSPAAVPPAAASGRTAGPGGITFQIPEAFRKNKPQGDINPLTGEEYLTNTVRRHPEMEEFVQVYDQTTHSWSDVREDYFWEFQEKKKQMLGNDYRAPILI